MGVCGNLSCVPTGSDGCARARRRSSGVDRQHRNAVLSQIPLAYAWWLLVVTSDCTLYIMIMCIQVPWACAWARSASMCVSDWSTSGCTTPMPRTSWLHCSRTRRPLKNFAHLTSLTLEAGYAEYQDHEYRELVEAVRIQDLRSLQRLQLCLFSNTPSGLAELLHGLRTLPSFTDLAIDVAADYRDRFFLECNSFLEGLQHITQLKGLSLSNVWLSNPELLLNPLPSLSLQLHRISLRGSVRSSAWHRSTSDGVCAACVRVPVGVCLECNICQHYQLLAAVRSL